MSKYFFYSIQAAQIFQENLSAQKKQNRVHFIYCSYTIH